MFCSLLRILTQALSFSMSIKTTGITKRETVEAYGNNCMNIYFNSIQMKIAKGYLSRKHTNFNEIPG